MQLDKDTRNRILRAQKNEITEHFIYKKLAAKAKGEKARGVLGEISSQELKHYRFWKNFTQQDVQPSKFRIFFYYMVARIFGLSFGLMLMEKGEESVQDAYKQLLSLDSKIENVIKEEEHHEESLLLIMGDENLKYTGSVILGLNDALVELTGALAGLTLALQNTRLIAVAGLITGIAASLSMAGSEYLSVKEEGGRDPVKASTYTGIAYIFVVVFLIFPYFIFKKPLISLGVTLVAALLIISTFNFYISVARKLSFKKRFLEMAMISLGVATLNFFIGFLVQRYLKIEV